MEDKLRNIAYIDGQNLKMGTVDTTPSWRVDLKRFEKILFPNKKFASSLYKSISRTYFAYLGDADVRNKIEKRSKSVSKKEKRALGS